MSPLLINLLVLLVIATVGGGAFVSSILRLLPSSRSSFCWWIRRDPRLGGR